MAAVIAAAAWLYAASRLWSTTVPGDLRIPDLQAGDYFSKQTLDKAGSFERFLLINGILAQVVLIVVLALYARSYRRFTKESAAGRIGTGLLLGMLAFAFVWLAQLPFDFAALAWERHHGVSKQGYLDLAIGGFLGLGGQFLFICMAIAIVMALARPFRRTWWIPAAPVFAGLALLFAFVTPYLLPDLKPLSDRELKAAAQKLAKVESVEGTDVKVLDVHEFTTMPNAHAAGFGPTRQVVLWDTLVRKPFTDAEVRTILAHEFAHHERNHILKRVGLFGLFALPLAFAIAVATRNRGGMFEPGSVPLALLVLTIVNVFAGPVQNAFVNRWETEADWTGLNANRDPAAQRSVMKRLATTSLTRPDPPELEHLLLDTHPTILDRIALTRAWEARNSGAR